MRALSFCAFGVGVQSNAYVGRMFALPIVSGADCHCPRARLRAAGKHVLASCILPKGPPSQFRQARRSRISEETGRT